jgi:hypothetical protein
MPDLACQSCGEYFRQGQGRPARRCGRCRQSDRYGAAHRELRAATVDQAAGQPCARCGQPMVVGQLVHLDHADDDPSRYLGYSHASCNASAGASRGNQLRAAAYRAAVGLQASAGNGVGLLASEVLVNDHSCGDHGCHADPDRCSCGRHSRGW